MTRSARIVVTSGEPAGIGPDLCIALAEREWPCELVIACDRTVLEARARQLGKSLAMRDYRRDQTAEPKILTVAHFPTRAAVYCGKLNKANARYVLDLLDYAVDGCVRGEFSAMVTAPVQKSIVNDAGITFTGHTEYLAERAHTTLPVMMLVSGNLRVALATTHLPLAQVSQAITRDSLHRVITILDHDLRERFDIQNPRILVCGLNPHAGESGHLGREEIETIVPVLAALRARGLNIVGPAPADTAFTPRMLEDVDAVLAMYHDQGLPVLKYAGFGHAVNVTLGLPMIRTSVDHGTALDLAGTGKADAGSLIAAVEMAVDMASRRVTRDA
ncbi:MAG TPA: 4-hydroxythreonine-4-phosphate dehydrogenase PdxA [Steroidobacteraceae bacterium]|nr:4-hydroxythreonine-4-phosphate dehydrogenase PdxA [Steroidobacteraceae bacterium]